MNGNSIARISFTPRAIARAVTNTEDPPSYVSTCLRISSLRERAMVSLPGYFSAVDKFYSRHRALCRNPRVAKVEGRAQAQAIPASSAAQDAGCGVQAGLVGRNAAHKVFKSQWAIPVAGE